MNGWITRREFMILNTGALALGLANLSMANMAGEVSTVVRANGLSFNVLVNGPGRGRTIMLLHGFPQDSHTWAIISEALARHGYRTVAPDLRGTSPGTLPDNGVAFTFPDFVNDVIGIADALGVDRFDLCGFGMGSALAWITAATFPERIQSLIALRFPHPVAFAQGILNDPEQQRVWQDLEKAINRQGHSSLEARAAVLLEDSAMPLKKFLMDSGLPADATARYVARLVQPGMLAGALAWEAAVSLDDFVNVPAVTVPTLFVWSKGPALTANTVQMTKKYVDAPYQEIFLPDAGHFFIETSPHELIPLILQHLDATGTRN